MLRSARNGREKQEHFEFDCRFTENAQSFAVMFTNENGGDYSSVDEIPPRELVHAHDNYWSDHDTDEEDAASFHIYPTDEEMRLSGNGNGGRQ